MYKRLWREGQGREIENNAISLWHARILYAQFCRHASKILPCYNTSRRDQQLSQHITKATGIIDIDVTQTR